MRIVLALALILSACSLIYELLVAQSLSLLAGNTVVWYSLTVGAYLAAMGIGAVLYGRREPQQHWAALYRVEMILSLTGALAVLVVHGAHLLYLYLFEIDAATAGAVLFFGLSFAIILFLGLLSGIELPLLIQLGNRVAGGRVVTNRVLGWDYIGALVAGVAFPVLLIPYLELLTIGLLTAGVNLMVALVVLRALLAKERRRVVSTGLSAALGAFLLLGFVYRGDIQQYYLKRYYYTRGLESFSSFFGPMSEMPAVFRASSPYQKIDLVHHPTIDIASFLAEAYSTKFTEDPDKPRNRFLFLNGDFQVASNYEELYHEWFAHVPIMLNGRVPERVLVMGAGDGLLHRELLKHDNLRRIIHVDIDRTLVELARTNPILTAMNELALDDPRVETRFGDAFEFIRRPRITTSRSYTAASSTTS
jgi:spermidine synthase